MSFERTGRSPHVVNKFSGYHRTSERNAYDAPPGTLAASSGFFVDAYSTGYVVTNTGKLRKSFGSSHVTTAGLNGAPRQIYWWERQRGGGVLIVEGRLALQSLNPGPPQGLWQTLEGDASITYTDQRERVGRFISQGDFLFYVNGIDRPKKIRRYDLKAYHLGLTPPDESELPTSHYAGERVVFADTGLSIGVYEYAFTFSYSQGGESNGSLQTKTIEIPGDVGTVGPSAATKETKLDKVRMFVHFDGFPDAGSLRDDITHINVYRTQANGSIFFFVGRIPRGYRSFLDDVHDTRLGRAIPLENDPPPVGRYVEFFDDRLWMVGSITEGSRDILRYSARGFPDVWPPGFIIPQSEWVGAGPVTGLRSVGGILYVFFENAIFVLEGSRAVDYRLRAVSPTFGCVAPETLRVHGNQVLFLSKRGIGSVIGGRADILTNQVFSYDLDVPKSQSLQGSCAAIVRDQYVLSFPTDDFLYEGSPPDIAEYQRTFSLNLTNGGLGRLTERFDFASDQGFQSMPFVSSYRELGEEGHVRILGYGHKPQGVYGDSGFYWTFNWDSLGDSGHQKTLDAIEIDIVAMTVRSISIAIRDEFLNQENYISDDFDETERPGAIPGYYSDELLPSWNNTTWTSPASTTRYRGLQLWTLRVRCDKLNGRRFQLDISDLNQDAPPRPRTNLMELQEVRWYWHGVDRP